MDFSVVVPTFHRNERLKKCLSSLAAQKDRRYSFEVIVVDDAAAKATEEVVAQAKNGLFEIRYIAGSRQGPAGARNRGIAEAKGKLIGFVDDDCLVAGDWVSAMGDAHQRFPQISCIGGATALMNEKPHLWVSQKLSDWSIETFLQGKKETIFFPTCNVSCKREVFDTYRFDERFHFPGGEDLDFFWRLFKAGRRFLYIPAIKVLHDRDVTIKSFLRQAFVYGRGNFMVQAVHQDHPLLKELKSGPLSFWFATLVNSLKIPRFSLLCGRRLIQEEKIKGISQKLKIYYYFIMHKIYYIAGNIREFFTIQKKELDETKGYLSVPRLLILDITHRCNLACRICDIWKTERKDPDLELASVERLLAQGKELGIQEITLSGGEPLLRNDIFEIFEAARKLNIKNLGVLTNGLMVEKHLELLLPYLSDNTVALVISFDSLKEGVHNSIRNSETAWEMTHGVLKKLSALKHNNPLINFNVITIVFNQNLEELKDIACFIYSLGANSLQFQPLLPNNLRMSERKTSAFWVKEERLPYLDVACDQLVALKRENPHFIKNSVANLLLMKKYFRGTLTSGDVRCQSTQRTVLVSTRGECTTCFSSYGDIRKEELKDIFRSSARGRAAQRVQKCAWPCLLPCFCDEGQE